MSDVPSVGVAANWASEGDDHQYIDAVIAGSKPRRHASVTRLPLRAIGRALQSESVPDDLPGQEYLRARMGDRASCPLCSSYSTWNRALLKQHVASHPQIKAFKDFHSASEKQYESLQRQKERAREQIAELQTDLKLIERELREFDYTGMQARERDYQQLLRLLY